MPPPCRRRSLPQRYISRSNQIWSGGIRVLPCRLWEKLRDPYALELKIEMRWPAFVFLRSGFARRKRGSGDP